MLTWMMGVQRCVVRGVLTWMVAVAKFSLHAILGLLLDPFWGPKKI